MRPHSIKKPGNLCMVSHRRKASTFDRLPLMGTSHATY